MMARLIMAMTPMEVITVAIMEATTAPPEEEAEVVVEAVVVLKDMGKVILGRGILIIM